MRNPAGSGLDAFFAAQHVVFVGASRTEGRLGHTLAHNLVSRGFAGRVDFVNPRGGELFGRTLYPDVAAVPGQPDLAVLLVPAPDAPMAVEACADRGIRLLVIASGGFAETGEPGRALESSLRSLAAERGLRIVGPNCVGLIDTASGLDTSFLAGDPVPPGHVTFISHSGAMCASMIEWARELGFGLSRMVSLGNQVDLNETDSLRSAAADPGTTAIALYLESVADGRRFIEACDLITRDKPVVALKAGRSEAGSRAAASHTGALAGRDAAFEAAFRAAGVIRAQTTEDLVDRVRVLARYPGVPASRVAILTNAGGPGVAAADACVSAGLEVATLSSETTTRLRAILPAEGSVVNPVDLLASASADLYGVSLSILLAAEEIDAVVVLLPPPPGYPAELAAHAIVSASRAARKPVVVACMGGAGVAVALDVFRSGAIETFRYPEQAVSALSALREAAAAAGRPPRPVSRPTGSSEGTTRPLATLIGSSGMSPTGWLSSGNALEVVRSAGVSVAAHGIATSPEEAVELAARLGYPVVLKSDSSLIVHKTDVGAVVLGIPDADHLHRSVVDLTIRIRALLHGDTIASELLQLPLLIQEMAPSGVDLIVGMVRDAQFGPLIMVGTGGTAVETDHDVAFAVSPLGESDARSLLGRTAAANLFRPSRGRPGLVDDQVIGAILALSVLADGNPDIQEMEVNPLRVFQDGRAVALDARVRVG